EREAGGCLDPADVKPAPVLRRVLRGVHDRAAVLAAVRKTLHDPQRDQQDRREDADRCVSRQDADAERREAHHRDCDHERLLAARSVADPPEYERAERTHCEARRERQQREDERGRLVDPREELARDQRRKRSEQNEVVGFEDRPGRRSEHDAAKLAGLVGRGDEDIRDRVGGAHASCSLLDRITSFSRSQRRTIAVLSSSAPTSSRPSAARRFTSSITGAVAPSAAPRSAAIATSFARSPSANPVANLRVSTWPGKLMSVWKLRPVDVFITSTITAGSSPKRLPTISASAVTVKAVAATTLFSAFIAWPQPSAPVRTSRSPSTRSTGSAVASAASSSAPIMIVSVPVWAFATSPETGASINAMPRARSSAPSSRVPSGSG